MTRNQLQRVGRWRSAPRLLLTVCVSLSASLACGADLVRVHPKSFTLDGQHARQQLVVLAPREGRETDWTHSARYRTLTPEVVQVSAEGLVTGVADGQGRIEVLVGDLRAEVPVNVRNADRPAPARFELDVQPVLTRLGCNAGACHGKSRGQGGFALSLLGFYPDYDYAAISQEARGRRVRATAPETSLLLLKATAAVPHGGGKRMEIGSPSYEILHRWIAQGLPRSQPTDPTLERVTVFPTERLLGFNDQQQLVVTAHYSDGSARDVTALSAFQSNETTLASVDADGVVRSGPVPGEAAIMARFMGKIALSSVLIPVPGDVPAEIYAKLPRNNVIDGHVWDKLQRLGITPSEPASETTWLRRAHLDVIGRLPTPEEVRAFLTDTSADKRQRTVDALLNRPEYADFWANKWADLLRPNPYRVGIKAVFNLDAWIRDAFRKNLPYDEFVRQLVSAQGSTWDNGAVTIFRDRRTPDEQTTIISQLFLGIRLECAKCHHHPFEVYGQEDFYGFAAYFAKIGRKGTGLSPPISGSEEIMFRATSGQVTHPLTGEVLPPKPLFGQAPPIKENEDPRRSLAVWMTSPENPYFARVIVNRVWADLMGRGIVEPVDDLRATNPPSNEPLLDALATDFRAKQYDLKQLLRTIVLSNVYSLSSEPNERNIGDTRNYSRHYRQRLRAESLLDAVSDITSIPERFDAMPPGSRATQLWTHRSSSTFLDSFGRPDPNQDPPCERTPETTVVQVLHLMNSPQLHRKVTDEKGRAAQLASSSKSPREIVEELYLLTYSRFPTDEERQIGESLFQEPETSRVRAAEDLLWALMNTAEFVFKD